MMNEDKKKPPKQVWFDLEGPVIRILDRLDGPSELVSKSLGEKLFNRHIELLGEDNSQARIDVVLDE